MVEEYGFTIAEEFYTKYLNLSATNCGKEAPLFLSVGAGNCDTEIRVALVPRLFPLPAMLRARLTQALTDVPLSDSDVTRLLDGFDADADDTVKLFTAHGFSSDEVFFGEFKSVKSQNIRWKSDSELEISYEGTPYQCTSTRRVKVLCFGTQQNVR